MAAGAAAWQKPVDEVAREYFRARVPSMAAHATANDIEKVLAFYTDDVVYEDPAVKVRIVGKDQIRSGMLSHVEDYVGSKRETHISVDSMISLANAVGAITTELFWTTGEKGRKENSRKRFKVLEFRGDLICRVIDYH